MPRQRLPVQYFADIVTELRGVNERLDTLIAGPASRASTPATPATAEPEPVRLQEPSSGRPEIPKPDTSGGPVVSQIARIDADFPDSGREENARESRCPELTSRGSVCGRPLPCRYHG